MFPNLNSFFALPTLIAALASSGLQARAVVQIRDFIMSKGHNKNLENTLSNQVNNIPLLSKLCSAVYSFAFSSFFFLFDKRKY